MRKILFILLIINYITPSNAQIRQEYVIASMGGFSSKLGIGTTYYTVGEMSMVKTFSNNHNMLTQGFLQGNLKESIINVGGTELPVKLLDFTGFYSSGADHLVWHTATEIDNDHFDVERMDSHGHFISIGQVRGAGNSNTELSYSFDDTDPQSGVNYYRLKQVDVDGQFAYSDIISVTTPLVQGLTLSVYPNPAQNYVNVAFSSLESHSGTVTMTDIIGKVVYQSEVTLSSGTTVAHIDMSGLESGQYIIRFSSDLVNITSKVTKGS